MKKIWIVLLSFLLIVPIIIFSDVAIAADNRTLQDLYNELNAMEKKLDSVEDTKKLTNQQIEQIKSNIAKIGDELTSIDAEVIQIGVDIENLNVTIEEKDAEIKKLVSFLQVTNGESMYLEYAFGAQTMTDFIYRVSIVEQMTTYNEELINEMNRTIEEKNQKTIDLADKKVELQEKKVSLAAEQNKLGSKLSNLYEEELDVKQDISDAKKVIKNYEKMGCKLTDKISVCAEIPQDTSFARPLISGYISGLYGKQNNPLNPGTTRYHSAIDIGGNPMGTPVYATAAGTVVRVYRVSTPNVKSSSCGGNYVVLQHQIDGVYYASRYLHLHTVNVSENQKVTKDTVIGTIGGGEIYDWCSTGPHLHFQLGKGIYGQDFYSFVEPYGFNPISYINVPNYKGARWTSRYQRIN